MLSLFGHLGPHMGLCHLKLTVMFNLCVYQHRRGIIKIKDSGNTRKFYVLNYSGVQWRENLASYITPTTILSTPYFLFFLPFPFPSLVLDHASFLPSHNLQTSILSCQSKPNQSDSFTSIPINLFVTQQLINPSLLSSPPWRPRRGLHLIPAEGLRFAQTTLISQGFPASSSEAPYTPKA